jgi:hypothetical protein
LIRRKTAHDPETPGLAGLDGDSRFGKSAAKQLAEKVHFRRVFVTQALLPVICFLPFDQPRTAKCGCATNFFRKL